jgi:hypothetical protein
MAPIQKDKHLLPPKRRSISKHKKVLGMNINYVMGPGLAGSQE